MSQLSSLKSSLKVGSLLYLYKILTGLVLRIGSSFLARRRIDSKRSSSPLWHLPLRRTRYKSILWMLCDANGDRRTISWNRYDHCHFASSTKKCGWQMKIKKDEFDHVEAKWPVLLSYFMHKWWWSARGKLMQKVLGTFITMRVITHELAFQDWRRW